MNKNSQQNDHYKQHSAAQISPICPYQGIAPHYSQQPVELSLRHTVCVMNRGSGSMRRRLVLLFAAAALSLIAVQTLLLLLPNVGVSAVVVDGTRKGPSALANQSHEEEMIDGYNTKSCGIADPDQSKSDFVNSAKEGQFPWLVSFQIMREDGQHAHFCMGSFISERWILSAAHCFADPNLKPHIDKGTIHLTGGSANAHHAQNANFTITRIFYHSKFDRASPIGFDVSLVEIAERAPIRTKFGGKLPFVNTVCLPIEGKEYAEGQVVKLAGWGDTESKDPKSKPEHLLTTDLVLTNGEQCANIFSAKLKKVRDQYHSFKDFICADYNGERDACQGDSGSSLLQYADGKAVAVGIVSYGLGCATKGVPGVYTRTSSLMPWIKEITKHKEKATVQFTLITMGNRTA